ncbi:MAG TPA: transposase [Pseudonocardiaceae bacterium]|nr:transposase [Pseudonocardiaceae bacterium]
MRSWVALVAELSERNAEQARVIAALGERIAELERRLAADSSNSSRPPSSDAPWEKKPARKRSARRRSARKPGKQPGSASASRRVVEDPDETFEVAPDRCARCARSLDDAVETARVRRQVVDVDPPPPPRVTEYQLVSRRCGGCGQVSDPAATDVPRPVNPGADLARPPASAPDQADAPDQAGAREPAAPESGAALADPVLAPDPVLALALRPGSPVRIGPWTTALAALLTCGHYLPIGRASSVLQALAGIGVSSGFICGVRGRAAALLAIEFGPHLQALLPTAGVLHADETTGRAGGALAYVHVACTEYLTLMHVGGRASDDIDAGGVLPQFTGILMRDGYTGYAHLPAVHAWCAQHLLRDLRAVSDADPVGQLWAQAMADTLLDANQAAHAARAAGADQLDPEVLAQIRNHYRGALAKGTTDNQGHRGTLAAQARRLIRRFTRYEDMILRFAVDLAVPFTNYPDAAVMPMSVVRGGSAAGRGGALAA